MPLPANTKKVFLVASGDSRLTANQACWPAQAEMEQKLSEAFARFGVEVVRAHPYDPEEKHGFIANQRQGMDVLRQVPKDAPLVVAEAVWQYSHHVLAGLDGRTGSLLTVANWSGQFPGLVGLLNLNGSLTKRNVPYSTLWSQNFDDPFFLQNLESWINTGQIQHDLSHVQPWDTTFRSQSTEHGAALARDLMDKKAILGVFDEGCMGMDNAIIDDRLLNPTGVYKERLSQSALYAEMLQVPDAEADACRHWLDAKGMTFVTTPDGLTDDQIRDQLKLYIAAVRLADRHHCDAIGIQYQLGLVGLVPASDLAEGLLNNVERPPVHHPETGKELFPGQALPHFNEVDEGAGLDALVTNRVWTALGFDPATTLHDVRYGEDYEGQFVWVFLISGAAPPSHFIGGYAGASSELQPPMYFLKGGGSLKGISKPGEIVWSRIYVQNDALHADLGRATVLQLPAEETNRRWQLTTPQWPIMHAVLHGVSRDQMMARHKANHLNVAYAPGPKEADLALTTKAAMLHRMGLKVHLCGTVNPA